MTEQQQPEQQPTPEPDPEPVPAAEAQPDTEATETDDLAEPTGNGPQPDDPPEMEAMQDSRWLPPGTVTEQPPADGE